MLREIVQDKVDILLVSETKVDPSFPSSQFAIKSFSVPFRLDRNSSGGSIILFVREEIPSKLLSQYKPNSSVENIFIELNLRSTKLLLSYSYNPNLTLLNDHTQNISRGLDFYSSEYDNFIVLGDFYSLKYDNFIVLRNFYSSKYDNFIVLRDFYSSNYDNFIVLRDFYSSKYDNFIVLRDFNAENTTFEFCTI